ncbi:MAG: dihydrolipoyl dehydrogenase [Candidatus Marinimicrobia bacterium]|nr:dihydrolipoyl dehydrogenase [Candidatus Neomarinimicrobiota bacterium]
MSKSQSTQHNDVIIIGGGPGGYVAAIRAAQLGKSVAVIEADSPGGVCLNWGCIPTKALLHNAEVLHTMQNSRKFGVQADSITVDWSRGIKRSRDVANRLSKGIEYLFKKNNIELIRGRGTLIDATHIEIKKDDTFEIRSADNVIIATGARAKWFPGMEPDGDRVITAREAMVLDQQPASIAIIGAGAIGVEFAHFFNRYGTKVDLIEALPHILPIEDEEISIELERIFKKRKIKLHTGMMVEAIEKSGDGVVVQFNSGDQIETEKVLVAVGVQGNIENLGLEKLGIIVEKGWIKTDEFMQTNIPGVYAIGDVAGPPWLAHIASAEGITASEHLCGKSPAPMAYDNVPGCTYCEPQVASVGLTEKAAIDAGFDIKVGQFPFRALGKAMATDNTDGFVKVIYEKKYGELLGCHIIGAEATDLITEMGVARKLETTWHEILHTIHPHPTLSEALMEATADALGEAIHI